MNKIFEKFMIILISSIIIISSVPKIAFADYEKGHDYIDFSSDRSTYFFRVDGGDNDKVFFDFFSPFDSTAKVKSYDPLSMYKLEDKYYLDDNGNLMINIEDLKRLYDPYFDYEIKNDKLNILHTVYDKVITGGIGERATTLEYTKKEWNLKINLSDEKRNSGEYDYTEYISVNGGRNKGEIKPIEINNEKTTTNTKFTFENSKIEIKDDNYYIPIESIMNLMGKVSIKEEGYLAIQQENLADVTVKVDRDEKVEDIVIPRASNVWTPGSVENIDENYTWADYMNDISDGVRNTGWMWKSFYIPSGANFKDGNGNEITLEANRIVPFTIYVPTNYNKDETRLTYMLHGGTGNENTPTHRLMDREADSVDIDKYAEEYNYIIVSPNGWTQNPIWRENQGLYSFEKSFEIVTNEFPVDEDKIFIAGNSLGGRGTLELAVRFSDRFNAIVVSAPKIVERDKDLGTKAISIEDTKYDLASISDMPTMLIQGVADATTSFKTQIGSKDDKGAIASALMPKFNNATYVTVEQGSHSYAYGSVIRAIFDFFESNISSNESSVNNKKVDIVENSKVVNINGEKYKLDKKTEVKEDTTMISLKDLQKIYGDEFKVYDVKSYDSDPNKSVNYYTIIYNNKSMNFELDKTIYRNNMERYKEDANILKSSATNDEDKLDSAPQFSVAPYEENGDVFVPVEDVANSLALEISISENDSRIKLVYVIVGIIVAIIFTCIYKFRIKKNN